MCYWGLSFWGSAQIEKTLKLLHPGKDVAGLVFEYYVKKLTLAITICVLGVGLALVVSINAESNRILKNGNIVRGNYQDAPIEAEISTVSKDGKEKVFSILVEPQTLTEAEFRKVYEEFVVRLPVMILQNNKSLQSVSEDLLLEESFSEFPFLIQWTSSRPEVLKSTGKVQNVHRNEEVILEAVISYGEVSREEEFIVNVVPKPVTADEREEMELQKLLEDSEKSSRSQTEWKLPTEYQGEQLVWKQEIEDNGKLLGVGAFIVAILVFFLADKDLQDELLDKRKQMKMEYPDVIQKLVLYLGAGLTVRTAFQKMATEYEEIQYTCRELQAGVSENDAYRNLGKRVGIREYLHLSTLLMQNLKRGNRELLMRLREEADRAVLEKMQNCRRLGEEASTKLLLPMVLFLLEVMIMIMLPAFWSMGV